VKAVHSSQTSLWPSIEELVPPELPREVAVARLVALARSLLVENRELRDALELERSRDLVRAIHPRRHGDGAEAA
jgi:hypothetical protein